MTTSATDSTDALPYDTHAPDGKIYCQIDGAAVHVIQNYLKKSHPDVSLDEYKDRYPGAPLLSEIAKDAVRKRRAEKESESTVQTNMAGVGDAATKATSRVVPLRARSDDYRIITADVMKLIANIKNAGSAASIPVKVFEKHEWQDMVPDIDENFIWDRFLLRDCIAAFDFEIPAYFWGHAGTGKTSLFEQYAANTNRPLIRIQHTANTEEAHILGTTLANEQGTYFQPGPLALAMKHGWVYLADEYDFAFPQVLGVYQPVLEGNALLIKEAPPEWRRIDPHPQFRFVATGNTNGSGDETGLYQGTNVQNAANYSRYGIVSKVGYLDPEDEADILEKKALIKREMANNLVDFATRVRNSYDRGEISNTIGPRELLHAAKVGGLFGGDFRAGLDRAFVNKLPGASAIAARELAERVFS